MSPRGAPICSAAWAMIARRLQSAADAARMRRADDGVARLDGGEHLEDDRRCRIGDRYQRRDHAHGLADGGDLGHVVLPEHAERLHVLQPVRDGERVEKVLDALVVGVAIARLFGGKRAEARRFRLDGARHGLHHLVDNGGIGAPEFEERVPGEIGGAARRPRWSGGRRPSPHASRDALDGAARIVNVAGADADGIEAAPRMEQIAAEHGGGERYHR